MTGGSRLVTGETPFDVTNLCLALLTVVWKFRYTVCTDPLLHKRLPCGKINLLNELVPGRIVVSRGTTGTP